MQEYVLALRQSQHEILGFQMPQHLEKHWTKGDMFEYHRIPLGHPHALSGQICGTVWMVKNTQVIRGFLGEWMRLTECSPHLFDDQASSSSNDEKFIEHRHDQSYFSLSAKKMGAVIFPEWEIYPNDENSRWISMTKYPFHARRDKQSKFNRLVNREMRYRIHLAIKMKKFGDRQ